MSSINSPLFLFEVPYHYLTIAQKRYLCLINLGRKQLSSTIRSYNGFFDKYEDSSSPRALMSLRTSGTKPFFLRAIKD